MFEKNFKTMSLTMGEDYIAKLCLNSAPVNTIDVQFMDDLEAAVTELENMERVHAVIIYSGLGKVFVAGADIKAFQHMDGKGTNAVSRRGNPVYERIENFRAPVICVVEGVAFGGGLELALACDIRIFGEKAKVGLPETSLGIVPGYGGSQRLPRLVGEGQAKKMLFTGAPVKAEDALKIGLCEEVTPLGEALAAAEKMAAAIGKNGPYAVAAAKRLVHASRMGYEKGIEAEYQEAYNCFETYDKLEGMTAFVEKRAPKFENR